MGKLTLSRKIGETIVIGENAEIEVVVSKIRGQHVDITVIASNTTPVNRAEVYSLSYPNWKPTLEPLAADERKQRSIFLRRNRP